MDLLEKIFDTLVRFTNLGYIIGLWFFFKKCRVKCWYALIPGFRDFKLSIIANRENDGRRFLFFRLINTFLYIFRYFFDKDSSEYTTVILLVMITAVPYFIFSLRIYLGLCERFNKRKRWTVCWIFFEWYAALYWAFSKSIVYVADEEDDIEAVPVSGINTVGSGKELTINIKERTVKSLFSKRTLLKDIHLNIKPGHMVLLLGGSGAGKTTFLNAVTGYEMADAEIILGTDNVYKQYKTLKHNIGFVPQQDLMRGTDTVYRTLADAAALRLPTNIKGEERKQRINDVLDLFGLGMLKNSLVDKLSGGQRKRLSIAMEFISDPKLFILDEPDSGLDGVVARGLFEKLREIADQGKIVIVITHTPDRVRDLFDDVIVLAKDHDRSGRLTYFGPVEDSFEFFGKDSFEGMLLAINQKEEGGEGRADELLIKYNALVQTAAVGGEA